MLICDFIAALCSVFVIVLLIVNDLEVWHLFIINMVLGFMNAFQSPASKVAIGLIVPKEHYTKISGLHSLSDSLTTIFTPVLATTIIAFWDMKAVLIVDIITFAIGFILLLVVKIPENIENKSKENRTVILTQASKGYIFLRKNKGLLNLIIGLSTINFIASFAFMSLLTPMILSRTFNNTQVLGLVKSAIVVGGIIGGIIVSTKRLPKKRVNTIFISAGLSFLFADILMGIGRNQFVWMFAAFMGSLPIPFLNAAETSLLYTKVPKNMQGRIFSIRGALQFITMPLGYITGGFLADYIFEPLMRDSMLFQRLFGSLVGHGAGSGIGLIFVFAGIIGLVLSFLGFNNESIQKLDDELKAE